MGEDLVASAASAPLRSLREPATPPHATTPALSRADLFTPERQVRLLAALAERGAVRAADRLAGRSCEVKSRDAL
ncbi:hypothetical protein ABTN69_20100, partial [Acinetobacter baumannii]